MDCIGFPKMFQANSTVIKTGYEATQECVKLLLGSEQGELFGDPQFGIQLKKFTFNQNNYILRDVLIDEIVSKLSLFCPQLVITRKDVKIIQEGKDLVAHIKAINRANFITNTFDLVLLNEEE